MATVMTKNGLVRGCKRCKEIYPLEEFAKDPGSSYGRGYLCKKCRAEDQRLRRHRRFKEMKQDSNHKDHGTIRGYRAGCRCDRCQEVGVEWKAEHAAYVRRRRRERLSA